MYTFIVHTINKRALTQGASGEVPVRKNVCETEVLVVPERVQVQEVGDVNVLLAELVRVRRRELVRVALGVVVDLRTTGELVHRCNKYLIFLHLLQPV